MDGLALSHYVRKRWPPTIINVSSGRCTPSEDEMASGARFLPKPYLFHKPLSACSTTSGSSLPKPARYEASSQRRPKALGFCAVGHCASSVKQTPT